MAEIDRRAAFGALLPLVVAAGAVVATYQTGLAIPAIEAAFGSSLLTFGPAADLMPGIAFAIIFVLVRLIVLLIVADRPPFLLRLVLLPVAMAIVLAAALYPTFGGLILQPGLAAGGRLDAPALHALTGYGIAADGALAGVMLALVTMIARGVIDWSWGFTWGKPVRALLALLAYAFMGMVLAAGWSPLAASGEVFPRVPLTLVGTIGLVGLVVVATVPQVLVAALGDAARRSPPAS
ncbi:hypothetical protein E8L99_00125 [Phreatobacter aquaticus]|uniref:Uncharacterized protein n=1 Tax=Phreatobacter aquaticus TaxID=2570229 RepID=A0A4D7Q7X6_9HYPH|nr:hypothetical protein [Phreatobacter aquaticus]QCK84310.1 hypothetical protein E8L99_00125 [Phreatobacter aquaticus]